MPTHLAHNMGTPLWSRLRRLLNTCLCLARTTAAGVIAGIVIADPEPIATVITGMDTVQLLPTQSHTRHLLPYTSNLAQDIIVLIQHHTDTVRTRDLPILMQTMVIITEVEHRQSGTAFGSSLEWNPHRALTTIPTEIRGTGATTLMVVREMKEDRGNTVVMWTNTGEKWIVVDGGSTATNSGSCSLCRRRAQYHLTPMLFKLLSVHIQLSDGVHARTSANCSLVSMHYSSNKSNDRKIASRLYNRNVKQ